MTLSLMRKVGVSSLFLLSFYVGVEAFGEGHNSSLGVRRLRGDKGRQLSASQCEIAGVYSNNGNDVLELTQTGTVLEVNFIGTQISFASELTGSDCAGYVDFASSGGIKRFTWDCNTGDLVLILNDNGATNNFTHKNHVANCPVANTPTPAPTLPVAENSPVVATPMPTDAREGGSQVSTVYTYTEAQSYVICDETYWTEIFATCQDVSTIADGGDDECAAVASAADGTYFYTDDSGTDHSFDGPAPAFLIWDANGKANCCLCPEGTTTSYPTFEAYMYTTTPIPTPVPTPQPPTPEPTPMPTGLVIAPTPPPTATPTPPPTPRPTPTPTTPPPTPEPTPPPTPQPTPPPTPLPPGATMSPTPVPTTEPPTPFPTPSPTYNPTTPPTPYVDAPAGWTMNDGYICVEDWGNVWNNRVTVYDEADCFTHFHNNGGGDTEGGIVVTNTGGSGTLLATGEYNCIVCEDHSDNLFQVTDISKGGWFHFWVYVAPTPSPTTALDPTPAPTPGNYPDHYAHQEAYACNQDLTAAQCRQLVGLYATNPAMGGEAFQTMNTQDIPTGCNYQPAGDILIYNTNQNGGGYQYLPTGDLILMCAAGSEDGLHLYIRNKHGICLDAKERRDRAGVVHMWPCDQTGPAQDTNRNQHWVFEKSTGTLQSYDGICLDASERSENGGQVWMWPCNGGKNQQWEYDTRTLQLKSKYGYCLDARQRSTRGGLVHMWRCQEGNKNQEWILTNQNFKYDPSMDYSKNILNFGSWMGDWATGGNWYSDSGDIQSGSSLV